MTYYSKYDLAHEFFYNDEGDRRYPSYSSCGYDGNRFLSYNTCIGYIATARNGERVLLISINSMSNTTANHLSALRNACPLRSISVYMEYGDNGRYLTPEKLAARALHYMDFYAQQRLSQAANRNGFLTAYDSYMELKTAFKLPAAVKLPARFKKLAATLNDSEAVKALKKHAAERQRRATAAAKAAMTRLLKNKTLSELARLAYDDSSTLDYDERRKIKNAINPNDDSAFVWYDDARKEFKTSKYVRMDAAEGLTALKLWKAGKLRHGLKVGIYTVLEVMENYVKIGCHKIPTRNLSEFVGIGGVHGFKLINGGLTS